MRNGPAFMLLGAQGSRFGSDRGAAGSLLATMARHVEAEAWPGAATSAAARYAPEEAPCEVLVVDDDPTILYLVAQALELEGHHVATASNGRDALDVLSRAHPQVALLDMRMPLLDGWGFAQAVKDQGIELKIVVMTATTDARRWAEEIGADGYLGKPFGLDEVLGIVDRMCRS